MCVWQNNGARLVIGTHDAGFTDDSIVTVHESRERERVEKATFLYAARSVIVATTLRRGRESFGSISISEICSLLRLLLRSPFSLLLLLLPRLLLLSVYGRSIPTKWSSRDVALTAPSSPFLI